ncbi:MAG: hypothetical protein WAN65_25715 [Candidatus Sulfotelmatobacter sp.]
MFRNLKIGKPVILTIVLTCSALLAQQTPSSAPPAPSPSQWLEFPVIMRQNIAAGKTAVGTKVEAKLIAATLVGTVVIPQGATLSGEVTESAEKAASEPSRLAIRMDSAVWKNGSAQIKVYLTAWYYPMATLPNQDLSYQPPDAARSPKNWNGAGTYPDPNNPASQPFPGRDNGQEPNATPSPSSNISKHRVPLKNVESTSQNDGAITLLSTHMNIKLDKVTTYVLASGDLMPRK